MQAAGKFVRSAAAALTMAALLASTSFMAARDLTLEDLKGRLATTSVQDRPPLCIQISERQLEAATQFYVAGESDKAQAALTDVTTFSELARDYAIQSHRSQKQSEIAIRKMTRKLNDLKHSALHEDQETIQKTIDRLQSVRDDLLSAMFHGGNK
jgi:hypothetical protein